MAVFQASYWAASAQQWPSEIGRQVVVVEDALFDGLSGLESPARMGFVLPLPVTAVHRRRRAPAWCSTACRMPATWAPSCAAPAAFGFRQVLAIKGTAALWSPKVLRAGMGAHFGLRLRRRAGAGGPGARCGCRCWPPARTRATSCTGPCCPGPAPGCWATKGRAWAPPWRQRAERLVRIVAARRRRIAQRRRRRRHLPARQRRGASLSWKAAGKPDCPRPEGAKMRRSRKKSQHSLKEAPFKGCPFASLRTFAPSASSIPLPAAPDKARSRTL